MGLKPLHGNVLIHVASTEGDKRTAGGLIIPGTVRPDQQVTGRVVSVGTGHLMADGTFKAMTVKEGDTVLFNKAQGVKVLDDEHFVLAEEHLLGVLT